MKFRDADDEVMMRVICWLLFAEQRSLRFNDARLSLASSDTLHDQIVMDPVPFELMNEAPDVLAKCTG